jgi:pilus assembly protein CpaF
MNSGIAIGEQVEQVESELMAALRTTPALSVSDTATARVLALMPLAPPAQQQRLQQMVVANLTGLGVLDPLLADPTVTELMVSGGRVWVERHGELSEVPEAAIDDRSLLRIVERIISPLGLQLNRAVPMVDARLADGSRLNAVIPPLALDGPAVTIRRFAARQLGLTDFTSDSAVQESVTRAVAAKRNIVVSGSTGSGKTTLLNTLGSLCNTNDRIVTIEDAAELRLPGSHVVRLEARVGSADGQGRVTIRDLVRNAMRMRPDRLVIGEVRGGEAFDMITALNTGHDGSMTTVHANSAGDALRRLELMMLLAGIDLPVSAVREHIAAALDVVVHVARSHQGRREIVEVKQVTLTAGVLDVKPL